MNFIIECLKDFLNSIGRSLEIAGGIWIAVGVYFLVTRFVK